jgi:hypothetical protein
MQLWTVTNGEIYMLDGENVPTQLNYKTGEKDLVDNKHIDLSYNWY